MFPGVSGVRSIRTEYRGVLFMSALEANFAKTMDKVLGIVWSFEPDGVKLPNGENYRPDFWLPHLSTWLEVKGPHNQRIHKPDILARACLHAPGCELGRPEQVFTRPVSVRSAGCACGFGEDFPWRLVIVGRPAVRGRLTFEPADHDLGQKPVVLVCPHCRQRSFVDFHGLPVCRRCHRDATGGPEFASGMLPFATVEPPRGRPRNRAPKKAA